ncbi:MAG: FAD-dependent oxidoreductase [Thiobacillus sp.]|nr:FAD-dependent oxidoreductase [Thiobacillus sp.]
MKRLLLIGGGHAHLFVLEAFARAPLPGVELVLVSPNQLAPYSGMMPGVIAWHYHYDQGCVDLAPLVRAAGCRWLKTIAVRFDPASRVVLCENGSRLDYDLLSINTGSTPPPQTVPGVAEYSIPVKPIETFLDRWRYLSVEVACRRPLNIVVVGGGAAGVEVVTAMRHRLARSTWHSHRFHLVGRQDTLLHHLAPQAGHAAARVLRALGITLHLGQAVNAVTRDYVALADGTRIDSDFTIWATGSAAPAWPRAAGLAVDDAGFIAIEPTLRSCSHPDVFAAGDVASLVDRPHPKSGVYAVKAGPVLAANLRAALQDQALTPWTPQTRALALLSTGDRHAIGAWGNWVWQGRWAWRWKDYIDRRFVARFAAHKLAAHSHSSKENPSCATK